MATLSLSDIETEVRARSEYDSNYITSTEMDLFTNMAVQKVHEIARQADTSRYMSSVTFSTVADQAEYPYNTWLDIIDIKYKTEVLRRVNWADRFSLSNTDIYSTSIAPRTKYEYAYKDGSIWLYPTPNEVVSLTAYYTPDTTLLTRSPSVTMEAPYSWKRFVIYDVLVQCALKAEDDSRGFQAQADRVEAEIRNAKTDSGSASHISSRRVSRRRWW